VKADADIIRAAAELVGALAKMREAGPIQPPGRHVFSDGILKATAPESYEAARINAEVAAFRLVVLLVRDIERQGTTGAVVKEGGAA
jgi:hypothetical protein